MALHSSDMEQIQHPGAFLFQPAQVFPLRICIHLLRGTVCNLRGYWDSVLLDLQAAISTD